MNTTPSIDELLESLIFALGDEILPYLTNEKSQATAVMMQSVIQEIRQLLPVFDAYVAQEHNEMTKVLRDVASLVGGIDSEASLRISERGATLGAVVDVPVPENNDVNSAHRALGFALQDTLRDLDELQRKGFTVADDALDIVRSYLYPTFVRYANTVSIEGGMVGRG
jgi:hypothetical protein